MRIPTFGIGSISRSLEIAGKALELQTTKLWLESANNLEKYQSENNITPDTIEAAKKLTKALTTDLF